MTQQVLFLPAQQLLRKSPKLPARRADVIAAGRARPRSFVLLRRLRLLPLPKAACRRPSSAFAISATLPHGGATSDLREDMLSFYMQDGEPVFLSHTELNIEEPPFTPFPNDGTYDVTQLLQEWELTRTNGVQTGMTQAQVEEITGPLTTDQYGYWLLDSQNVSYSFGQNGYQTPQLMEMNWSADVRNDELFHVTVQDSRLCVPPHRGSDSQRAYNPEIQSVFP